MAQPSEAKGFRVSRDRSLTAAEVERFAVRLLRAYGNRIVEHTSNVPQVQFAVREANRELEGIVQRALDGI